MDLLVKKAQKGDENSFFKLIDEYMSEMYKVAKTRLNNEEDIGDAIQETIISSFNNIKKLKEPRYFKTWLIKILINKCNDILKDNKVVYVENYGSLQDTAVTSNGNLGKDLEFDDILNCLSAEYRTVVVMYYVNKFTTKEIGEILSEKEGTIKSRLSRARQQLKILYLDENIN